MRMRKWLCALLLAALLACAWTPAAMMEDSGLEIEYEDFEEIEPGDDDLDEEVEEPVEEGGDLEGTGLTLEGDDGEEEIPEEDEEEYASDEEGVEEDGAELPPEWVEPVEQTAYPDVALDNDEAQQLLLLLSRFPETVRDAADKYEPSFINRAVTDLAKAYNKFYYEHRVLEDSDPAGTAARLALTEAVRNVIRTGLGLLGIEAPERM